jgi:CopG family transcriptional regulator, nickel-responsive regulator
MSEDKLSRIGISIETELIKEFDRLVTLEGYPTRWEAIKRLVKNALVKTEWQKSTKVVAGAIVFIYDHHRRELINKMMDIQHNFGETIISVQHIHLDHHNCMEIVAVKGQVKDITRFMVSIQKVKGIKHSDLLMTTTG